MTSEANRSGPIGRLLRLVVGISVMIVALPVYFEAGWAYNLRSLGIVLALAAFYTLMHFVITRYVPNLNRCSGAILAVAPVFLVWFQGQGGGLLFGQGEGGTGAITYVGVSLLIDFVRGEASMKGSKPPSRTAIGLPVLCPLRVSLTYCSGCRT